MSRLRPSGAGDPLSGTLYIGSLTREDNILYAANRKALTILELFESQQSWHSQYGQLANGQSAVILTQHAGQDTRLPADSIDYIFTDPPFGSNIFYSDVNLMWEAWLGYFH